MYSRTLTTVIILFWLTTTTWLVATKVLPLLQVGDPPNYRAIVAAQRRQPTVGWDLSLDGHPLGWALTTANSLSDGSTEMCGRIHFDELPLAKLAPDWSMALKTVWQITIAKLPRITMDASSNLVVKNGRLTRFDSTVQIDRLTPVRLFGTVDGAHVAVRVESKDFSSQTAFWIPPGALLDDSLSPQTQLPGLHVGQTWTVPTYSPLRPLTNPVEILRAKVEGREEITWNGHKEVCDRVTYRRESGFSMGGNSECGHLWVRGDGTVLIQDTVMLDARITFVRAGPERAAVLAKRVPAHAP